MRIPFKPLCVAMLAVSSTAVLANEDVVINGFLSAGVGALSTDKISYSGFDGEDPYFKRFTRFGVQLSKQITDEVSVTGQLVSSGQSNFEVDTSWAYVTYQFTDELAGRIGRFRMPLFHFSDFLDVGYAYHWITPPSDVYSRVEFSNTDGMDINYSMYFGDVYVNTQFYYGGTDVDQGSGSLDLTLNHQVGFVLKTSYNDFSFRVSAHRSEIDSSGLDLFSDTSTAQAYAFAFMVPVEQAQAVLNEYNFREKDSSFFQLSAAYDDGQHLVIAEWTGIDTDCEAILNDEAWFVSYAYRIGKWTPHITYSVLEQDDPSASEDAIHAFLNNVIDGSIAAEPLILGGLSDLKIGNEESESVILGVKYDLTAGVALKFEVTQHEYKLSRQGAVQTDEDGMLYGFAVDAVY